MSTTQAKLLLAASDFIRRHPNGESTFIKDLMADACADAAKALGVTVSPVASESISDENVRILLKAGGYQQVKQPSVEIYGFLLRNATRDWSAQEISARTKRDRTSCSSILKFLADKNIIKRRDLGRYQAT